MALPASSALPPPTETTTSQASARAWATPARTCSTVGSPATASVATPAPGRPQTVDVRRRARGRGAVDQQHAPPRGGDEPAELIGHPPPEDDATGGGELEGQHGVDPQKPASSGWTFAKTALERGAAIIGATASRHAR